MTEACTVCPPQKKKKKKFDFSLGIETYLWQESFLSTVLQL